jgi:2-keto-4-pentenoate hydratase/2-oxohepta-3-ene-1,7-dioic acid hydratase in catechol pathway
MRLATAEIGGAPHLALADGEDLRLLPGGAGLDVGAVADRSFDVGAVAAAEPAPDGTRLLAPLRPATIVAIGLNYLDHIRETGMDRPARPLVFSKFRSSVAGPGDPIRIDAGLTEQVDWEVELAVVIGRRAARVPEDDALGHVFGYTVANDVSARDLQFGDGQWVRGKSLDTFCPLGPVVVTADEIADPQALALRTRINGETVQDSSTSEMLFGVAELISFCSHSFTLEPGDVLLTGTPWGCGAFMDPPRFLQPGDVLETEIDGIGTLENPVVAVDAAPDAAVVR